MDRVRRGWLASVATATLLLGVADPSAAGFVLKLEDISDGSGGAWGVVIPDGGVGDVDATTGVIVFSGSAGRRAPTRTLP
jgi:hypothetical protein